MGLAIAKEAVDAGAHVMIAGRSQANLDEAREAIAGDVAIRTVDLSDEHSVKRLFSQMGSFDHLVVTGSSVETGPFRELLLADARDKLAGGVEFLFKKNKSASMDGKFWGQYVVARYAQICPKGSITLFSGILSSRPLAGLAGLAAINAAVEALGRALALELAAIRVNVVSPGLTDTPAYWGMADDARRGMFATAAERSLVGRVGRPEDIASLALELRCNSFMTGVVVDVDGGGLLAGLRTP
jgi:NAD(P)-dependent dehydrogenase (short-subunit alcohol dehydrogenase family)